MPYIQHLKRSLILQDGVTPQNCGELNFLLTKEVLSYLDAKGESYQSYNDVLGVLTAIQHELYRRRIAAYEDAKITLNGDVF